MMLEKILTPDILELIQMILFMIVMVGGVGIVMWLFDKMSDL